MSNTSILGSFGGQAGDALTFKNRLINGDMKISQRFGTGNATIPASSTTYTTDRWFFYLLGAGGTASQVTASVAGHTKALKLVPSAGNTYAAFVQRIESANIEDLASSVVTFSGWVYVDNATGVTATVEAYTANSVDAFNAVTQITITNPTISLTSGSYVYFEKQITLPANATNGVQVGVSFTGVASKDVRLTGASLEAGPTATPFERRPIGVEQNLCERYCEKITAAVGVAVNNVAVYYPVVCKVTKRDGNNLGYTGLGAMNFYTTTAFANSSPTFSPGGINWVAVGGYTGLTAGVVGFLNSTTGFLVTSEL